MRKAIFIFFLNAICIATATASPFTVSSPSATAAPKIKIGSELKDTEGKETRTLPNLEYKVPVAPSLDFAAELPYKSVSRSGHATETGIGDVKFKSKWNFFDAQNLGLAIEPVLLLPTGNDRRGLGNGDAAFELPLILGYQTNDWELGSELGYTHIRHQDKETAYLGVLALRRVTQTLRVGAELIAESPQAEMQQFDTSANVGLQWKLAHDIELEALAGRTLHTVDHAPVNKFKLAVEVKL